MQPTIACIGAAHIDRKAFSSGDVRLGTTNLVRMFNCHGGVARNVAENLARLGAGVGMVSRVGPDSEGRAVLKALQDIGIETTLTLQPENEVTASYTALINRTGAMVVAMADMDIYDRLDAAWAAEILPELARYPVWFMDCNLQEDALRYLIRHKPRGTTLYVDCVSVPKSRRLSGNMRGIDVLILNDEEASALSGIDIRAPLDICEAGARFMTAGVGTVVITRGASGCFLGTPTSYDFLDAIPAQVKDVTGAGDALAAGLIFRRTQGHSLTEALKFGMITAALTIATEETVCQTLTEQAVTNAIMAMEAA